MSTYISALGILAAMALSRPANAPSFTFSTDGSVDLTVAGTEARIGLIPAEVNEHPVLEISLGATSGEGSLSLYMSGDQLPSTGRYPVRPHWFDQGTGGRHFHPCLIVGSLERPLGVFHGESGWVTISRAEAGWIAGVFELEARGFLGVEPGDENRWVTVRGSFEARGDSTITAVESVARSVR
jgi:hypothetical protein